MGYTGQRIAETVADWTQNQGGALLDLIAKRRQQGNSERELALREELGRGDLSLGRDRLTADVHNATEDRNQRFTLQGFENTAAGAPGGMSFAEIPEEGNGVGVANAGAALEGMLSQPSGSWRYNRTLDPTAINQEDEQGFRAGESSLERSARLEAERMGNQNTYSIAKMGEEGADRRSKASIESSERIATMPPRTSALPSRAAFIADAAPGMLGPRLDITGTKFSYPSPDSIFGGLNRTYDLLGGLSEAEISALQDEARSSTPAAVAAKYRLSPAESAQAFGADGRAGNPLSQRRADYDDLIRLHGADSVRARLGPRP